MNEVSFSVAIPARLKSSRFPKKMITKIGEKPLLQHVWDCVRSVVDAKSLFVLTDSKIIENMVNEWGGQCIMTSEECVSGTERISSVINRLKGDFIVNIQGDEIFLKPEVISKFLNMLSIMKEDILTLVARIYDNEEVEDPNCVKVVLNKNDRVLYFSRSVIPYSKGKAVSVNMLKKLPYWKHIGIYAYKRHCLEDFYNLASSYLEEVESLEQMKLLYEGYNFQALKVNFFKGFSINTPYDAKKAEKFFYNASK